MLGDIVLVLFLILLNGVFAMTELAVVSSRRNRLQSQAEAGRKAAKVALELKDDPSRFLSTVQIGITLIGIFSGAFSGVTLATPLGEYLLQVFPLLGVHADDVAMALVVTVVTYLSLVIGELVPKQIALRHADAVAVWIAVPIYWLSQFTKPIVVVLDVSNRLLLKALRIGKNETLATSEEDVKAAIAEGMASGSLEAEERQMMDRVMQMDDIRVTGAMTHRSDIVWFDLDEAANDVLMKVQVSRHSRYLLCNGGVENVVGIVVVKDMLLQLGINGDLVLRQSAHAPTYVPETSTVLEALEIFKRSTSSMGIVVDEYGTVEGIVTLKDIMEVIVGTLPEPAHREDYAATARGDGSWLVDGGLSIHEVEEALGIKGMAETSETFTTVAGFLLFHLGHIPNAGDDYYWESWRFEVVDMDGNRIDKVLATPDQQG